MLAASLKADIEGEWIKLDLPVPHYGKRLSTQTAWQVYDPQELRQAPHALVSDVTVNLPDSEIVVHYSPGLEFLDLGSLRELLHLTGPLAVWRTARVALDLCRCLQSLHAIDIPQMIVHPERIGQLGDRLVLAPTLPGVLPPLSRALGNLAAGWFHYIAPETLRTRGLDRSLLFRGDVYSLGRTLEAMCMTGSHGEGARDIFVLAARRVETTQSDRLGDLPPTLRRMGALIARMCALLPEQRPSLEEVVTELDVMAQEHGPPQLLGGMTESGGLAAAELLLEDLKQAHEERVFRVAPRTVHLLTADVMMMPNPPDCGRAVMELEAAEAPDTYEGDVQIRMARAYARFDGLSTHVKLSAEAYMRAARLENWPADVVEEWLTVLGRLADSEEVLALTSLVPVDRRPVNLTMLRVRHLQQQERHLDAWHEIALCLAGREFSPALFALAREVAARNDSTDLVRWMHQHRDSQGHEAAMAIVWERNGNPKEAQKQLGKVRGYTPPV